MSKIRLRTLYCVLLLPVMMIYVLMLAGCRGRGITPAPVASPNARLSAFLESGIEPGSSGEILGLLDEGASIETRDSRGRTPLIVAAQLGDARLVDALLQRGADANALMDGGNAVYFALVSGRDDIETRLMASGARVPTDPQVVYYLLRRPAANRLRVLSLMLRHGMSPDARTRSGATPLMMAAEIADLPMVRFLLQKGANVNAKDQAGETAADYANWHTHWLGASAPSPGLIRRFEQTQAFLRNRQRKSKQVTRDHEF